VNQKGMIFVEELLVARKVGHEKLLDLAISRFL
jgi:hypothetical protein